MVEVCYWPTLDGLFGQTASNPKPRSGLPRPLHGGSDEPL
jgi:hypothetical protein